LSELINILQNFANDPSFDVYQTWFGSYIAYHVIKEKIQGYNNEAMIPPKLGDVWIPKILVVAKKIVTQCYPRLGIKCKRPLKRIIWYTWSW
jgi:hypothetical protein